MANWLDEKLAEAFGRFQVKVSGVGTAARAALNFTQGFVRLTDNAANDATDMSFDAATQAADGVMPAADKRKIDKTINYVVSDNATDCNAAILSAINATPAGGTVIFPDGDHFFTAPTVAKPIRLQLGKGTYTSLSGPCFLANANVTILGQNQNETILKPMAGSPAIKLDKDVTSNAWLNPNNGGSNDGHPCVIVKRVQCFGGTSLLDVWRSIPGLTEGKIVVDDCLAYGTTDYAVKLWSSINYAYVFRNQFNLCFGSVVTKDNTELKLGNNQHKRSGTGKWSVLVLGGHRVNFDNDIFMSQDTTHTAYPNVYADILIASMGLQQGDSVCSFSKVYSNPERVWSFARERVCIDFDSNMTINSTIYPEGSISSSSPTLTLAGLSAGDIGKSIIVRGAGAAGQDLFTTISNVSGSTVTLAANAGTTVSHAYCVVDVATNAQPNASRHVVIDGSRFQGSDGNRFGVTAISRTSNVATVTFNILDTNSGIAIIPGDYVWVLNVADSTFRGKWQVTSVSAVSGTHQSITFANTGSDTSAGAGGVIYSAETSAIRFRSPAKSCFIDRSHFENFGYKVDDSAFMTSGNNESFDVTFGANSEAHAYGIPIPDFKDQGRPCGRITPSASSAHIKARANGRIEFVEVLAAQNFISPSEDFTHSNWTKTSLTVTASQPDPWKLGSGTRGTKVTRNGSGTLLAGSPPGGGGPWTLNECCYVGVNQSSFSRVFTGSVVVAADDANAYGCGDIITLFFFDTSYGYLAQQAFKLPPFGPSDKRGWVRIALHYNVNHSQPGYGGSSGLQFGFVPGFYYANKASCYVTAAQVDGIGGGPYVFTNGVLINDSTCGMVLERDLSFTKMRSRNRAGLSTTVTLNSDNTIGTTGTASVVAATDTDGLITFTPGGTGISSYFRFDVVFSEDFTGQAAIPKVNLIGTSGANWQNAATPGVRDPSNNLKHGFSGYGFNNGVNLTSGSSYRIAYHVDQIAVAQGV